MRKYEIVARLIELVRSDLETLERAHQETTQGVTHEDARQEGDKDMRSTEASYVARGQAQRVVELQGSLGALVGLSLRLFAADDPVALGALVTVEFDAEEVECFVAPAAGGARIEFDERTVRVITPRSPLGRALLGRALGDDVTWETPHGDVEGVVVALS